MNSPTSAHSSFRADIRSPIDFRAVVEGASDLLTVLDGSGSILYDNPAVREILGFEQGELVGRSAFELIHRGDYPEAVRLLAEVAEGRMEAGRIRFRFRTSGGEWRMLESRGRAVSGPSGPLVVVSSRGVEPEEGGGREGEEGELEGARVEVVERLARAAEFRDDETGRHQRRVGEMSAALATRLGLSDQEVEILRRAAPLHDVGKIGIPDAILRKPGPLLPEEEEVMRTHTLLGAQILAGGASPLVRTAEAIALCHHERWDGRGYPWRIAGDEIPLPARIVALVDVYDALTHDRPYRPAWTVPRALELIRTEAGSRFDPEAAAVFLASHEEAAGHGR